MQHHFTKVQTSNSNVALKHNSFSYVFLSFHPKFMMCSTEMKAPDIGVSCLRDVAIHDIEVINW